MFKDLISMSLQSFRHKFRIVEELFFRDDPAKGIIGVPTPRWQAGTVLVPLTKYSEMGNHVFK